MRFLRIVFATFFLTLLYASCSKDHYDVSNVHGVNAEGEVLLPVASKTFTIKTLMERFEMQDAIEWSETGDMTFCFNYENNGAVRGEDMLKFDDVVYEEHYAFENPYQHIPLPFEDTVLNFEQSILFKSDNIHVMRAQMKSGRIEFVVRSNFGQLQKVRLRSDNITDASGSAFQLDLPVVGNTFGFDLEGLHYVTDTANTLNLRFDLCFNVHHTSDPELSVDLNIRGFNLSFSQMDGIVDRFDNRNSIDSVFSLFSSNLGGMLELDGVRIKVSERNTFNLGAQLVVDTAMVYSEGLPPYSVLEPLPLSIDLPQQLDFREVFDRKVSGRLNAEGGRAYATSNFIVNPENYTGMVTVADTSRIDTRIDVEIPFSFSVDDIIYLDTVNMNLQHLEMPDMIEKLTLELGFVSTLPLNLKASFFMYDSQSDMITDTLLLNADLIEASFDGKPVKTELALVVDEDRVERVMRSDRIIMSYRLDSEAHDVSLNANQKLDLILKARAKYEGDVELTEQE